MSNIDSKVDAGGEGMFCFLEYGLKFKTLNGIIFLFIVNKILHCTFKNASGIKYGTTFFQKYLFSNI